MKKVQDKIDAVNKKKIDELNKVLKGYADIMKRGASIKDKYTHNFEKNEQQQTEYVGYFDTEQDLTTRTFARDANCKLTKLSTCNFGAPTASNVCLALMEFDNCSDNLAYSKGCADQKHRKLCTSHEIKGEMISITFFKARWTNEDLDQYIPSGFTIYTSLGHAYKFGDTDT